MLCLVYFKGILAYHLYSVYSGIKKNNYRERENE